LDTILTPVPIGELADKLTILEIKADRIADAAKVANVRAELDGLRPLWQPIEAADAALAGIKGQLREVNERMWDIQDALRDCEAAQRFDAEFVRLARAVATTNAERIALKNEINRRSGSRFVEEKQYKA
jgi:hypothetical protein